MRLSETIGRRQFLKGVALGAVGLGTVVLLGCESSSDENGIAINPLSSPTTALEQNPDAGLIAPEAGWKIYHGEAYEIEFPQDWSAHDTSSDPNEQELFIADGHFSNYEHDDKSVYVNFSIEKLDPDETTIEDYKARVVRGILYERGDEITGREKGIQGSEGQELLGQPSTELYYTVRFQNSYDQKNLLRMQVMGRNVIRLKYSASSDNFDKYKPVFEHMAASLRLK